MPFETGPFETGPFETGPFETGPFGALLRDTENCRVPEEPCAARHLEGREGLPCPSRRASRSSGTRETGTILNANGYERARLQRSVTAGIPMALMYASMPLGFGCGLLFLVARLRAPAAMVVPATGPEMP